MKVYIIGTGADGKNTLTKQAALAIEQADLLIGSSRMLKPYENSGKRLVNCYRPEEISETLKNDDAKTAAVLMSGDCGFFSGTKKLLPYLDGFEIIPGISSAAYFFARSGLSYENTKFVSLHGKNANIAINVLMNETCFFILGSEGDAAMVCERLCEYGLGDVKVHIGENLGYENEKITVCPAKDAKNIKTDKLSVLLTENEKPLSCIPSGIKDSGFVRAEIPMTKAEIRCTSVATLDICKDSVCWDIGCGSGSVSVEMAFRCPDGRVYAFDKKSAAVSLTKDNAKKFGCDNITVKEGSCPEILVDALPPQKVFIGGSSGELPAIFDIIYKKSPTAEIVVTAVSLETLQQAAECFEKHGRECTITQVAVTRTRKVGSHTMFDAQNPVFIIKGVQK